MKLDAHLVGVSSSIDTGDFYKALGKAQGKYTPIKRSGANTVDGYRYATLRDICDATMPGLLASGFTMPTFQVGFADSLGEWVMVGTLCHESGQWVSSVCPLLMGFDENDRPGIQVMEAGATYAKKILMQGLCGGWLESEEGEQQPPQPEPKAVQEEGALPAPVRQKKSKKQAITEEAKDLLKRAEEALAKNKDDHAAVKKILDYLQSLVDKGRVPSSEAVVLAARYVLDAEVTDVIQREEAHAE
jgi:hypothetical protein